MQHVSAGAVEVPTCSPSYRSGRSQVDCGLCRGACFVWSAGHRGGRGFRRDICSRADGCADVCGLGDGIRIFADGLYGADVGPLVASDWRRVDLRITIHSSSIAADRFCSVCARDIGYLAVRFFLSFQRDAGGVYRSDVWYGGWFVSHFARAVGI